MGQDKEQKQNNPWRAMAVVGVIGFELAALLLIGLWVGKLADKLLDTSPIFLMVGMVLGLAIGIWSIVKLIKPFLGD